MERTLVMNLNALNMFVLVVQHGGFSEASRKSGIAGGFDGDFVDARLLVDMGAEHRPAAIDREYGVADGVDEPDRLRHAVTPVHVHRQHVAREVGERRDARESHGVADRTE